MYVLSVLGLLGLVLGVGGQEDCKNIGKHLLNILITRKQRRGKNHKSSIKYIFNLWY